MRIALTLAVATVFATSATPAYAGNDVGVIVTGEGSMQSQLAAQIEDWLSQHGHTLVQTPLPPDAIPLLDDCVVMTDPQGCARRIIETRAKTTTMVYARIKTTNNATSGARDVTLVAYWFNKGHDAVAETRVCESCTDQSLRNTADSMMKKLSSSLVGHLKLKSVPDGARISIDGQAPIGITPLDWDLPPGKHTITLTKEGYEPAARDVVVVSERTDTVSVELAQHADDTGPPARILPIALIAGGGALLITGGVLFAIDQDPGPDQPKRIWNTDKLGIGIGAAGLVAGGVGTYLLLRSPGKASAPVAAVTHDSAYIGWTGRF